MILKKLSIKQLTVGIIVTIAVISIMISLFAGRYYFNSALKYQYRAYNRVIQIGTEESMRQLQAILHRVASGFAANQNMVNLMSVPKNKADKEAIDAIIRDILSNGFVDIAKIDLLAIRLYSMDFEPLVNQHIGSYQFPDTLVPHIYQKAINRSAVDRLKALYDFWQFEKRPYYSVLVPVGGLSIKGYMELVVDPVFNLNRVAQILNMPVKISSTEGKLLYQSENQPETLEDMHPIQYQLRSSQNQPALSISAYIEAESLKKELLETMAYSTFLFLGLTLLSLLAALLLFSRYLFDPMASMVSQIKLITQGNLHTKVSHFGLYEFSVLAKHFNMMTSRLNRRTQVLEHLSKNDALTGIANRRYFEERFEQEFHRANRENQPMSILLLDIDFFKKYNDHYGHQQGDICIRMVAQSIYKLLERPGDFVARYGGEEFVVLLPNTDKDGAFHMAEEIRKRIKSLRLDHKASVICDYVTVSLGGRVLSDKNYVDTQELFKSADDLLYLAKSKSRNKVIVENLESATEIKNHDFESEVEEKSLSV